MQVLHDPTTAASSLARHYHEQHKARVARIESGAVPECAPVMPCAPQPLAPVTIEISEPDPGETCIQVVACNGQVVIVTESEVFEANARFRMAISDERPSIDAVQRVVSRHYNVSRTDMLSSRRTAGIVRPRQIGMYLCKTLTLRSFPEIGRRFGGRDHTTALHSFRKIEALVGKSPEFKAEIDALVADISASMR